MKAFLAVGSWLLILIIVSLFLEGFAAILVAFLILMAIIFVGALAEG